MGQKSAEFPLTGKVLEFRIDHDDGAWDGLAGARIDDGFQRRVGTGGDDFGEVDAGRGRSADRARAARIQAGSLRSTI